MKILNSRKEIVMTNETVPVDYITGWTWPVEEIPDGWLLCDGENETYDLRDKYPDMMLIQKT